LQVDEAMDVLEDAHLITYIWCFEKWYAKEVFVL
jgi:hypothetical protein